MGRVLTVTDSLGNTTGTAYDTAGRKASETDALGRTTRFGYDDAGRLTSVTEASGAVTRYGYDAAGNKVSQTDANGHVWTYQYDLAGRMTRETDPLNRSTRYTFDALGNLATKIDAKGQTLTYEYQVRRLTAIVFPGGARHTIGYDTLGRRTSMSNGTETMTYKYDTLGRVTEAMRLGGSVRVNFLYDAVGNRSQTYVLWVGSADYLMENTYDGKNRLQSIELSGFWKQKGKFRFAYDSMDRRTELVAPNGMTTRYAYDAGYRLTGMATTDLRGQLADAWSYTYDAVGNRTTKTDLTGRSETYQYDEVDRLTRASYGDGTEEAFTYDPAGNRLTRATETGVAVTNSYDVANQLLTATSPTSSETYGYDANGSVTSKVAGAKTTGYVWDAMNRLTRVASGYTIAEESRYYPDGSRSWFRSTVVDEYAQRRVIYDPSGNPLVDEDIGGPLVVVRVYGPGVDELLGEYARHVGEQRYMHRDALGSITAVTDTEGKIAYRDRYTAFGTRTRTGAPQDNYGSRIGFTGRENAIEGLMQYRSRYYDTGQGRFLSNDSYRGNDLTPPSLHRYTYVHNNPVKCVDPSGNNVLALVGATAFVLLFVVSYAVLTEPSGVKARSDALRGLVEDLRQSIESIRRSILAIPLLTLAVQMAQAKMTLAVIGSDEASDEPLVTGGTTSDDRGCYSRFMTSLTWIGIVYKDNPPARAKLSQWAGYAFAQCLGRKPVLFPGEPGWTVQGGPTQ